MHAEERELMGLLRQHATLLRTKKHNVYLLDNGIKFTLPDWKEQLRRIRL